MEKLILIVDDAMFMRQVIRKNLEEAGYKNIVEAKDGAEGVKAFEELHPDLVILDITMPVMSGIEALEMIKQVDSNARVIMCSAVGQELMIAKSLDAGASDFIVKPFEKNNFERTVRYYLDDNRA